MENINAINLASFPLKNIRKVSDLVYYHGPLLSHYVNEYGDNYLFYWVDSDDEYNRWLVIRKNINDIRNYLDKTISLFQLLQNSSDEFFYIVDIDEELNYHKTQLIPNYEQIPQKYLPKPESFYTFEPKSSKAAIDEMLVVNPNGILQATFKNSSKVGYGTMHLEVFSPVLHHIEEMTVGLGYSFYKLKQKGQNISGAEKPKINKSKFLKNTQFEIAGIMPGSFKLLLNPVNKQLSFQGEKSDTDNYCNYFLGFIEASFKYDQLVEYMVTVDSQVIKHYEKLLKNIQEYNLDFQLKWSNKHSNFEIESKIDPKRATIILENINRLEYDNTEEVIIVGRFIEISLKTNHFTFLSNGDKKVECKGYFDILIKNSVVLFSFNKTYQITIKRSERKEAGQKKPKIEDLLIAFIEYNFED